MSKYDEYDFGFTAVDADELNSHSIEGDDSNSTPVEVSAELDSKLEDIESKLNAVLIKLDNDDSDDFSEPFDFSRLEGKVDQILTFENSEFAKAIEDQGSSISAIIDEIEERKGELDLAYRAKLKEVEDLVLPLLYNLLKNPDKEYILWPNRTEVIQKQINRIIETTRT